jgi:hypothetical protein
MQSGICVIAPAISGSHAYVPVKKGVACVELATGKVVGELPGFSSAYAGFAMGDGLIYRLGKGGSGAVSVARGFPEMRPLGGTLPGTPDKGEIHAPATANGRVYWRGRRSIWCYDFRKDPPPAATKDLPTTRDLTAIATDPVPLANAVGEPWPTRAAAADLLRGLGEKAKPAVPAVRKHLSVAITARDWGDVDLLLDTLLAIDPAATKPVAADLEKLLDANQELAVRLGFHALTLMGPQAADATPALVKHLDPGKPELAPLAAKALGRIGPGASAAAPDLLRCLTTKNVALTCQIAKALCHIAPTDAATRAATIDAALAHPWFIRIGGQTSARRNSYRSVALSLLGKEALPQFLEKAKALLAAGLAARKGTFRFDGICDLAGAAFIVDPTSATDFLPILAKIPRHNPPTVDGTTLRLTIADLEGKLDQRDPLGHRAAREKAAK